MVTAAELLSVAACLEGRHAQAFPSFGSERTGAPVVSFCRIGDHPIRTREPVLEPDALIVQDPTLLHQVDVFGGAVAGSRVLINSKRTPEQLGIAELDVEIVTVPATEIALARLGRPLPNAALLGAFAGQTRLVSLESIQRAIRKRFAGSVGEANAAAAADAFEHAREPAHA